ncbi:MAG TPA: DUF1385 domain-containing protein [Dehalococcoidia bacterium]|nr:DUF1385 domain-containing protein [Dehalococcoidia bacterium]
MARPFYYGGQAVLEGVMMRGRHHLAVAVRRPNGSIALKEEPLTGALYRRALWSKPFFRGFVMLWDALVLGIQSLLYSAQVAIGQEADEISPKTVRILLGISLSFAIGLFFVAPLALVHWLDQFHSSSIVSNLVEGAIRLTMFLGYLLLVGRLRDVRRVFAYHGAEHKTINAYEAGALLDVSLIQRYTTVHTRCGTAFLLIVIVISILVFTLLGQPPLPLRILSRIILVPVLAAVAYEVIRFMAGHCSNELVRLAMKPGLALQKLTTREPTDDQVEVAMTALKAVLVADGVLAREPAASGAAPRPVRVAGAPA